MARSIAAILAVSLACVAQAVQAQPNAKPKLVVELRWVETRQIEGITEKEGFQASCDPMDRVYPHQKPALVLTKAEVSAARQTKHDMTKNGLGVQYMVTLDLTKAARDKLAASVRGNETRLLTVVVDGKCWGVRRYEKDNDKEFVPAQARANTFRPDVGFFSSYAEAQILVDAFQ